MKRLYVKKLSRGISELVVILLILAIAIPAVILLQSWLTSQVSTLPVIEKIRSSYQVAYPSGLGTLLSIQVSNDGRDPVNITSIKILYRDPSSPGDLKVYTYGVSGDFTLKDPQTLPTTVYPGKTIYMTLVGGSRYTIEKVYVYVTSSERPGVETQLEAVGS